MKMTALGIAFSFLLLAACEEAANNDNVALSSTCTDYDGWQKAADLREVPGTVVNERDTARSGNGFLYIQTSDKKRYFACNLPTSVQKNGTSVVFDATEFSPPSNIRLAGTPVKLTKLRTTK